MGEEVEKITEPKEAKVDSPKKTNKEPKPKKEKKPSQIKEDVYIIESLTKKNGSKYFVKWENYSHEFNTWEPKASIPEFIVKFYEEDPSRLGSPAPTESQAVEQDLEDD